MKEQPTTEQIAKLPKWAQDYINTLDRRMTIAERALKHYLDSQTPSAFFYEDLICIGDGPPLHATRYIQTDSMSAIRDGVRVDILLRQDDKGIEIAWSDDARGCRELAMIPTSFQKIRLVQKDDIRK